MSREDLEALRLQSAQNNAKQQITGVLFYSAGHFVQLLEGDMEKIHTLFEKISKDPRHQNVKLLVLHSAEDRIFSKWDMGLLDLDQHGESCQRDLAELVKFAESADESVYGAPLEMEILSRFCMMLPDH